MSHIGNVLKIIRTLPTENQIGTVIFLPGAGMTGYRLRGWIRSKLNHDLTFPHLKIIYPTATPKFYSPWNDRITHVWFNRQGNSRFRPIDPDTLTTSRDQLIQLVYEELNKGIPMSKMIIGGFAMGGIMSLHLCYRSLLDVGGVFALSSFLLRKSEVYKDLDKAGLIFPPPVFMCNGKKDRVIPYQFGLRTFEKLSDRGVEGHYHTMENAGHNLDTQALILLQQWIYKIIPNK